MLTVSALSFPSAARTQLGSPLEMNTSSGVNQSRIGGAALFVDLDNDGTDEMLIGLDTASTTPVNAGAVLLIDFQGCGGTSTTTWSQANLGLINGVGDFFGYSLAAGFFDDDEWADVAIGIPGNPINGQVNAGAVLVVYGHPSGFGFGTKQVFSQGNLDGAVEAGDYFGAVLAVGDFDQNGYDDLVVSSLFEDVGNESDAGAVHIIYSDANGLSTDGELILHQDVGGVQNSAQDDDFFGHSLAVGEFSGDIYPDLAVGIPGESIDSQSDAGAVQVFLGSAGGITTTSQFWHQSIPALATTSEEGDEFGFAVAAGDFDGDGADDLAIGVPGQDLNGKETIQETGMMVRIFGDPGSGLDASNYEIDFAATIGGPLSAFDRVGETLSVGDFNADGRDDVVFGSPLYNEDGLTNSGGLVVHYGASQGTLSPPPQIVRISDGGATPQIGDEFSFAAAAGRPRVGLGGQWLVATAPGRESPFNDTNVDVGRVFMVESTWPFADDFESGSLCRWDAVSP